MNRRISLFDDNGKELFSGVSVLADELGAEVVGEDAGTGTHLAQPSDARSFPANDNGQVRHASGVVPAAPPSSPAPESGE